MEVEHTNPVEAIQNATDDEVRRAFAGQIETVANGDSGCTGVAITVDENAETLCRMVRNSFIFGDSDKHEMIEQWDDEVDHLIVIDEWVTVNQVADMVVGELAN